MNYWFLIILALSSLAATLALEGYDNQRVVETLTKDELTTILKQNGFGVETIPEESNFLRVSINGLRGGFFFNGTFLDYVFSIKNHNHSLAK